MARQRRDGIFWVCLVWGDERGIASDDRQPRHPEDFDRQRQLERFQESIDVGYIQVAGHRKAPDIVTEDEDLSAAIAGDLGHDLTEQTWSLNLSAWTETR